MQQSTGRAAVVARLVNTFRAFYGSQKLITVFTTAYHIPVLSQLKPVYALPFCVFNNPILFKVRRLSHQPFAQYELTPY